MPKISKRRTSKTSQKATPTTAKDAPPTSKLLELPAELQKCVVDYITSRADLKNLCLTCKELQAVALPPLYHTIETCVNVFPNKFQQNKWTAAFKIENPGLAYVRHVKLIDNHDHFSDRKGGDYVRHFLRILPKDVLQTFQIATFKPVSDDITYLLRLRQRRLTNYVLNPLQSTAVAELSLDRDDLEHVTDLTFFIRTHDDAERAYRILRHTHHAKRLSIMLSDPAFDSKFSAAENGLRVITTIFETKHQGEQIAKLQHLHFRLVNLKTAGPILPTLLDCSSLESLFLMSCKSEGPLFESLSQTKLHLKTLTVESLHSHEDPSVLEDLLLSFTGLEELRISSIACGNISPTCSWSTIKRHSGTLRSLYLDDFPDETKMGTVPAYDRSIAAFRSFCNQSWLLEELAVQTPSIESYLWNHFGGMSTFLDCLKLVPKLRVLQMITYPDFLLPEDDEETCAECHLDEVCFEVKDLRMQKEAQKLSNKVFDELRLSCPSLKGMLIHGRQGWSDDCRYNTHHHHGFLRVEQKDLYGRITSAGAPVNEDMLKHHVPCSPIFDWHPTITTLW